MFLFIIRVQHRLPIFKAPLAQRPEDILTKIFFSSKVTQEKKAKSALSGVLVYSALFLKIHKLVKCLLLWLSTYR